MQRGQVVIATTFGFKDGHAGAGLDSRPEPHRRHRRREGRHSGAGGADLAQAAA